MTGNPDNEAQQLKAASYLPPCCSWNQTGLKVVPVVCTNEIFQLYSRQTFSFLTLFGDNAKVTQRHDLSAETESDGVRVA